MIVVLFEAWPREGRSDRYFHIAAALRPELDAIDGFLGIERFQSLADPGKLLSLSWWRDEEAVAAWRTAEHHRAAQAEGRDTIFADYRLRIAAVVRDYGMRDRAQVPQ
ncbi:antibiotic biosynthesis monooxygenase [Sphingomonas sp. JC676]|uniref:antibiotic biosynthesis monooxygenase family protein n=1 Tax=Sphingomonas sp. JC676 TaxID=2768065 RepID=UPI0016577C7A|nr:antibiotic biosynthesis monooxygenase [Sphingomonas sp. JC676]MBC9034117.1 antibiotic biosynthesis monooxygenase [Sphingomonas sp. JC676]